MEAGEKTEEREEEEEVPNLESDLVLHWAQKSLIMMDIQSMLGSLLQCETAGKLGHLQGQLSFYGSLMSRSSSHCFVLS